MIIANNLETTEPHFIPRPQQSKYRWYDYVIFFGITSIVGVVAFFAFVWGFWIAMEIIFND